MPSTHETDIPARYLIGIDLGTTNSALAYVDTAEKTWVVRDFSIPQLVAPGTVEARPTLPSFHYEAASGEFAAGGLRLPWSGDEPKYAVGVFAREHGAGSPGRLIGSAKSWLSHSGVDRTAGLLPWHGAGDVERLSPVEVSARYLAHLRGAWDSRFPEHPMAAQDVVLAVPASFDEVARELTIAAARAAGLVHVVLVEEPQAAFYSWIDSAGEQWDRLVRAGQKILVCDIGGGTSDFTLIRVRPGGKGKVVFHRVAVGEHLILGGDNLDLAIAHHVEEKLGRKLESRQWESLLRSSRVAKETLLGGQSPERMVINISAGGSKLVGGGAQIELTRAEVHDLILEGFLPFVKLGDKPVMSRSGFQEFGLPYARDAAMTRYLAAFLTAHREAGGREDVTGGSSSRPVASGVSATVVADPSEHAVSKNDSGTLSPVLGGEGWGEGRSFELRRSRNGPSPQPSPPSTGEREPELDPTAPGSDPARPDLILFNGGLFESPVLRQRLLDVLGSWFGSDVAGRNDWRPLVLKGDRLDLAVARGAAYYGTVRRGRGVRISGGLAHSYYIGVEQRSDRSDVTHEATVSTDSQMPERSEIESGEDLAKPQAGTVAICLLPAGVEEGQTVALADRTFNLLIRQPVEFPLYASSTRTNDRAGDLLPVDPEQMTALPPIRTVLQSGRKAAGESISVRLHARLTEIGTLDTWCAEVKGDRTWRLQFDIRSATRADAARHDAVGEAEGIVDENILVAARERIVATFRRNTATPAEPPESLVKKLETVTGIGRHDWPSTLLRGMWETLMETEPGRGLSEIHEARWLNLTGFCLRPGYGLAADDWRVGQVWKLLPGGVVHPKNESIRAEWWILWRRLAGGLTAGQQRTLADPLIADWRTWFRKSGSNVRGRGTTFQFGPHESAEVWRTLGSLELLAPEAKSEIGQMMWDRIFRETAASLRDAQWFALGRLGARIPVYGPLNSLVSIETVETWAQRIISKNPKDDKGAFALMLLCRRTGDRYRDVSDGVRAAALEWFVARDAPAHYQQLVSDGGRLEVEEQRTVFGESLPRGLRIE